MKALSRIHYTPVLLISLFMILVISGCSNYEDVSECLDGTRYGFLYGLWHGIIAPIDLVAMIWREDVTVFAPNNNGFWYSFGFVLGSGGWGFLGGKGARSSRRSRKMDR
ncbi:MAG: hypothetical protein P1P82_02360 [Bacteroidales bacterium]|nr:hypothetical protein [Bacteroidales bacterium]MDT8431111.1 hypothetical protein [Bacteroidales bacterium]